MGGLPAGLLVAQVAKVFPRDSDWSGTALLGRRYREANYLWVDIPGPEGKLRVWFDGERVILLDLACSHLKVRPDQLAGLFNEMPASLDTWRGTLPMPESELVFTAHGLAAFISRETDSIWHLALFPPLTLEAYQDDLRIDMKTRRRPLSG